jgi:site-specific DNA-methyltransferase (cytosine-N4-specific)
MGAIIVGDCLEELRKLPENSVHCCVTSPPYWGLRDYGYRGWFGGRRDCHHEAVVEHPSTDPGQDGNKWRAPPTKTCNVCGSWYGQLGLEPELDDYVDHMVEVFREVRRVLHGSGTFWLNIGDGWARQGGVGAPGRSAKVGGTKSGAQRRNCKPPAGTKPKDLLGVPWRLAFALQADGWWLRAENIWFKTNPMPSSATDRTTRAHEQVFMFAKNDRYFYDAEAVRESDGGANRRSVWRIPLAAGVGGDHPAIFPPELPRLCIAAGAGEGGACPRCLEPFRRSKPSAEVGSPVQTPAPPAPVLWRANCSCVAAEPAVPCVVLDPFVGSGTTALVADQMLRDYIGIDVNEKYVGACREKLERPIAFKLP